MVATIRRTRLAVTAPREEAPDDDGSWSERIPYTQLATGQEGGRMYARPIDDKWVEQIAERWDPNKLDVLHVSFTEDAERPLVVICGNHRLESARKRRATGPDGKPFAFWCIVYPGLTLAQEAAKFHAIDQNRKRHSSNDGYRAALVFNDPKTKAIDAVLRKHGLSMAEVSNAAQRIGEVRATGAIYRAFDYTDGDIDLFDRAVGTIIRAWGTNQGKSNQPTVNGYTIEAMTAFLWRYEDLPQFDSNKLVRAMQRQEQKPYGLTEYMAAMTRVRAELQKLYGRSGSQGLRYGMEVLIRLYNRKREMDFRLPYRWVSLSRALVRAEKAAYLKAGLRGDTADNDL